MKLGMPMECVDLAVQIRTDPFLLVANGFKIWSPYRPRAVWFLSHLLVDQKFMTLFSILFGAGYEQTMEAFQKNFPAWVEKQPRPGRGAEGSS